MRRCNSAARMVNHFWRSCGPAIGLVNVLAAISDLGALLGRTRDMLYIWSCRYLPIVTFFMVNTTTYVVQKGTRGLSEYFLQRLHRMIPRILQCEHSYLHDSQMLPFFVPELTCVLYAQILHHFIAQFSTQISYFVERRLAHEIKSSRFS